MAQYIYMDNSNVFIEGKRVSAVKKGMARDIQDACDNHILDNSYRIDFGKLHSLVAGTNNPAVKKAVLYGSRPPANDSLWGLAKKAGFQTVVVDRNVANKEKKVDTGMVTDIVKDGYTVINKSADVIKLVAGDGDFVPPVEQLKKDGFTVEVYFWDHASNELKNACSKFTPLNKQLSQIAL